MVKKDKTKKTLLNSPWVRWLVPAVLVFVWIAVSGVGGPYFGRISEVSSNDIASFLPTSVEATKAKAKIDLFRSSNDIPALIVFEKNAVLTSGDRALLVDASKSLQKIDGIDDSVSPPIYSDDNQAALVVVPINSSEKLKPIFEQIQVNLDNAKLGIQYKIGGPASFSQDLQKAFGGIDGTLLLVAVAAVFIILLLVYRSPLLPIIVLLTSMIALSASILVVWHLAKAGIVDINGQVQGILFILVIGATTDYCLLYVSRLREELQIKSSVLEATKASLRGSFETITASAGTVIVGLLCLLFSDLGSNRALGPVGGIGVAFAFLGAVTFLPAVLLLIGRSAFWPRRPKYESVKQHNLASSHMMWKRVGRFVEKHPRRIWVGILIFLVVACFGLIGLKANGVPQSDLVLGKSDARDAQALISKHFPGGTGTPVEVVISSDKWPELVKKLDQDKGIKSLQITATNSPSGSMPVGQSEIVLKKEILNAVTTPANGSYAQSIADQAYPFKNSQVKIIDDEVMVNATLADASDSEMSGQVLLRVRDIAHSIDSGSLVGGLTAIQYDTNKASERDRAIIIPVALFAITIILGLLLRSIVAPLILLLTTVLSFGTALGISSLMFDYIFGFSGADPAVVLFGFVFLVALGIDYNIFLMTRIREETKKLGVKKGTIKALVVTGGVITSAGVVLAATFAALGVIPIMFLAQIAFIVALGVLIDTIIVRSLLVPALTLEIGRRIWWPSKLGRVTDEDKSKK